MTFRLSLLTLLGLAACTFPTEGVELGGIDASGAPDACVPVAETCDGSDEDCDGTTDEGFASGDPCDGPDADLCPDDMMVCGDAGGEVCGDTSGDDNLELCNGPDLDEDCDGATDEGYALGACDGGDTDMCTEGTATCAPDGLGVVCGDATGNSVETCDGTDQDCIGGIDNGFDVTTDEANCGECGNPCTNANGTTSCQPPGNCTPVCNSGAAECNGDPDDGCELQDTPAVCSGASAAGVPDLTVDGDSVLVPRPTASTTGTSDRFVRIRLREGTGASFTHIVGTITLVSGAGTDFDLYVYCTQGPTPETQFSTATLCAVSGRTESDDTIDVGRADDTGDRSFEVIAEVRYKSGSVSTTCNQWTLTVAGNPVVTTPIADRCGAP